MRLDMHFCREFRTKGWVDLRSVVWRTVLDGMGHNAPGYEVQWLGLGRFAFRGMAYIARWYGAQCSRVRDTMSAGCCLLAAGCCLLAAASLLLPAVCWLLIDGWLLATGCSLLAVAC